jgi:hypothetical protein
MGLPNVMCMPADRAINPMTIPGTGRIYRCAIGSAISVPGEDASILCSSGWVSAAFTRLGANGLIATGTTAQRPVRGMARGATYMDTTLGIIIVWGGNTTGWLNSATGASV